MLPLRTVRRFTFLVVGGSQVCGLGALLFVIELVRVGAGCLLVFEEGLFTSRCFHRVGFVAFGSDGGDLSGDSLFAERVICDAGHFGHVVSSRKTQTTHYTRDVDWLTVNEHGRLILVVLLGVTILLAFQRFVANSSSGGFRRLVFFRHVQQFRNSLGRGVATVFRRVVGNGVSFSGVVLEIVFRWYFTRIVGD